MPESNSNNNGTEIILAKDKFLFNAITNSSIVRFRMLGSGGYSEETIAIQLTYNDDNKYWQIAYNLPSWSSQENNHVTHTRVEEYFDAELKASLANSHNICKVIALRQCQDLINGMFNGDYNVVQEYVPSTTLNPVETKGIWQLSSIVEGKSVVFSIEYENSQWSVVYPEETIVDISNLANYIKLHRVAQSIHLTNANEDGELVRQLNGEYERVEDWNELENCVWTLQFESSNSSSGSLGAVDGLAYLEHIVVNNVPMWRVRYNLRKTTPSFGNETIELDSSNSISEIEQVQRVSVRNVDYSALVSESSIFVENLPAKAHDGLPAVKNEFNGVHNKTSEYVEGQIGVWSDGLNSLTCEYIVENALYSWKYNNSSAQQELFGVSSLLSNELLIKKNGYDGEYHSEQLYKIGVWQYLLELPGEDELYTLIYKSPGVWEHTKTTGSTIVQLPLPENISDTFISNSTLYVLFNESNSGDADSSTIVQSQNSNAFAYQRKQQYQIGVWDGGAGYSITYDGVYWKIENSQSNSQEYSNDFTSTALNDLFDSFAYSSAIDYDNARYGVSIQFVKPVYAKWRKDVGSSGEYGELVYNGQDWYWVMRWNNAESNSEIADWFVHTNHENDEIIEISGVDVTEEASQICNGRYERQVAYVENTTSGVWQRTTTLNGTIAIIRLTFNYATKKWEFSSVVTTNEGQHVTNYQNVSDYFNYTQWAQDEIIVVQDCPDINYNGAYHKQNATLWTKNGIMNGVPIIVSLALNNSDISNPLWSASYTSINLNTYQDAQQYLSLYKTSSAITILNYVEDVYNGVFSKNTFDGTWERIPGTNGRIDTLTKMLFNATSNKVTLKYGTEHELETDIESAYNNYLVDTYINSLSIPIANCGVRNGIYTKSNQVSGQWLLGNASSEIRGTLTHTKTQGTHKWVLNNYLNVAPPSGSVYNYLMPKNVTESSLILVSGVTPDYFNGIYRRENEEWGPPVWTRTTTVENGGQSVDVTLTLNVEYYDENNTWVSLSGNNQNPSIQISNLTIPYSDFANIRIDGLEQKYSIYNGTYGKVGNVWRKTHTQAINGNNVVFAIDLTSTWHLSYPSVFESATNETQLEITPYDNFETRLTSYNEIIASDFTKLESNFNGVYQNIVPYENGVTNGVFGKSAVNEYGETIFVHLFWTDNVGWQLKYDYIESHIVMEFLEQDPNHYLSLGEVSNQFNIDGISGSNQLRNYSLETYNGTYIKNSDVWEKQISVRNKNSQQVFVTAQIAYGDGNWSISYKNAPIVFTQDNSGNVLSSYFLPATYDPYVYTIADAIGITNFSDYIDGEYNKTGSAWVREIVEVPNTIFVSKFNTGDAIVKFFESGIEVSRDESPVFLDGFWCAKYVKSISTKTLNVAGSTIEGVNGDYAIQDGNWKNSSNCYIINDGLNWKITNGTSIGATVYYQALISSTTQNIYGDEMPPFKMVGASNDEQVTITTKINVPNNAQEANVEMKVYQRVNNSDSLIATENVSFAIKDTDFTGNLNANRILYANKQLAIKETSGKRFCLAYGSSSQEPLNYQAIAQCAISTANASASPIVAFSADMSIRCNYLLEIVKYNANYYYYLYEGVKNPHLNLTFGELLNGEENALPYNDENTKIVLNENGLWYDLQLLNTSTMVWNNVGVATNSQLVVSDGVNAKIGDYSFFYGENWQSRFAIAFGGNSIYNVFGESNSVDLIRLYKGKLLASAITTFYGNTAKITFANGAFKVGEIGFASEFGNNSRLQIAIYNENAYTQCNKTSNYLMECNYSQSNESLSVALSGKQLMQLFGIDTYINGLYDVSAFSILNNQQEVPFEKALEIVYFENPLRIRQTQDSFYVNSTEKKAHLRANLQYTLDNGLTYQDIGNLFKVDKIYAATEVGAVGNDPISGKDYPIKLSYQETSASNSNAFGTFDFMDGAELTDDQKESRTIYYSQDDEQYTYHLNMPFGYEDDVEPDKVYLTNVTVNNWYNGSSINFSGQYVFESYDGDETDVRNKVYRILLADNTKGQYFIKKYASGSSVYWALYNGSNPVLRGTNNATANDNSVYEGLVNSNGDLSVTTFEGYEFWGEGASIVYTPATTPQGRKHNYYLKLIDKYGNSTEIGLYHITMWTTLPSNIYFKIVGSSGSEGYTGWYTKYGRMFPSQFVTLQFSAVSEIGMQYKITGDIVGNNISQYIDYNGGIVNVVAKANCGNLVNSIIGNGDTPIGVTIEFKDEAGNVSTQTKSINYISKLFRATHNYLDDSVDSNGESTIMLTIINGNSTTRIDEKTVSANEYKRSWNEVWYPQEHSTPLNEDGTINVDEALRIAKSVDESGVNGPTSMELRMYDRLAVVNNVLQTDTDGRYLQNMSGWNTATKLYPNMLNSFASDEEKKYWIIDNSGNLDFQLEFEVLDLNPSVTASPKNLSSPYNGDVIVVYDASAMGAVNESTNADGSVSYTLADSSKLTELFALKGSFVESRKQKFTLMSNGDYLQEDLVVTENGCITPNITSTSRVCIMLYSDSGNSASGFKLKAGPRHFAEYSNYDKVTDTGEFWVHNPTSNQQDWYSAGSIGLGYNYFVSFATMHPELGCVSFNEPLNGALLGTFGAYLNLNTNNIGNLSASEYFPTKLVTQKDKNNKNDPIYWNYAYVQNSNDYAHKVLKSYACLNDDFVDYSNPSFYVAIDTTSPNKNKYYRFENSSVYPDGKLSSSYSISKDLGIITFGDAYVPPIGRIYGDYYYHSMYRLTSDGYGDLYFYGSGTLVPGTSEDGQSDWAYVDLKIVNEGTNKLTSGILQFLTRGYITSGTVVDTVLDYNRPWDVQKGTTAETVQCIGAKSATSYALLNSDSSIVATRRNAFSARSSQTCVFGTLDAKSTTYVRVFWCIASALNGDTATQWINITRGIKVCSCELSGKYFVRTSGN